MKRARRRRPPRARRPAHAIGLVELVAILAIVVLLIVVALAGCGDAGEPEGDPAAAGEPEVGGTAVFGAISDAHAFSEFVNVDALTNQIMKFMLFMPLIRRDDGLELQPYLARSWDLAADGSSVTFHLRSGLRWHDGAPVSARDVLFTYRTALLDEVAYPQRAFFRMVAAAEALDSLTIRFDFVRPHAEALAPFSEWSPMPEHLLGRVPPAEIPRAAFNRRPVGNGPFRFEAWQPSRSIVFVANEDFPAELGGRPYLDRVVFRIIPEQTTLLTELRSGTIDMMRAIPPQEAKAVGDDTALRLQAYPDRSFGYLAWNTRDPLFADWRVRQALSLAIDRDKLVEALLYGYGTIGVSYVLPEVAPWAVDSTLRPLPYAPDSARALLASAGWRDADGDGVLEKEGRPFRFTIKTNEGNDLREDTAVIVQSDLAKVGVQAAPRLVEWTVLLNDLNTKNFEAYISSWVYDSFKLDPSDVFHSRAIDEKYNRSSYANPVADSLMEAALVEVDRGAARPLWHRFQRIIRDEAPYTFLYNDQERVGINERLQGTRMDARGYLVDAPRWWIPREQRQF